MNWFTLTISSLVISSFASILQRVVMKDDKSNPYSYAFIFHLLLGTLNLLFALIHGFDLPAINFNLVFFLIAATLWGGGTVFLFKALQVLEASEVTILGTLKILVAIVGSVLFLHEIFTWQKFIGTAIVFLTVILTTRLKHGLKFNHGVSFIVLMSFFYGIAQVIDAYVVRSYDPVSYLALSNLLIALILLLMKPKVMMQLGDLLKPYFIKRMLPLGILSSTQAIAFYIALGIGGHVSQMESIDQARIILTVLLATLLLKERDHLWQKSIAGLLATVGIVFLS